MFKWCHRPLLNYFVLPYYKQYSPPHELGSLIREFQVYHANWNIESHLPPPFITCLANTEQNLYFYVNDPIKVVTRQGVALATPRVVVTGPKYRTTGLLFGNDHLMIKVAFQPTGTYRLSGYNLRATVNAGVEGSMFWGDEINNVLREVQRTSAYDEMVKIVSHFFLQRFEQSCRPEEPIDRVAIKMLDPENQYTLKEWASMACLSLRQFERSFIARVGLSPKLFITIVRFEYAMRTKNNYPHKSWAAIALDCHYTDASHLLKTFKMFAEFPPSRFYLQPTSGYSGFPTG